MPMPKKPRSSCLTCGKQTARFGYKYCCNQCQINYQYLNYIKKWKKGEVLGLQQSLGVVSGYIKRYLREKYENKCCLCGWCEQNPHTKQIPLIADHINGNWKDNIESNLRLICPNCDSLTSTYAGLNRGKGRKDRVTSQRVKEARLMRTKPV